MLFLLNILLFFFQYTGEVGKASQLMEHKEYLRISGSVFQRIYRRILLFFSPTLIAKNANNLSIEVIYVKENSEQMRLELKYIED